MGTGKRARTGLAQSPWDSHARLLLRKFPEWSDPEEGQSILAPSMHVHRHVYFWNEKTEPEQLLSSSVLPGWLVLGVATHCHIDDQIDVLDQWDLQGFLYFLKHGHLSL